MLYINKNDINVKELDYEHNSGIFKYEFEYKDVIFKDSKRLYSIDDLMEEDCDNLLQVEFINIIRNLKRGYGSVIYIINNLDLIDDSIKDKINSIE